jgi:hypothetical protein
MKKSLLLLMLSCSSFLLDGCGAGNPPPVATHLAVIPSSASAPIAGTPTSITVNALDASNNVVTSYSGTVQLTSTDSQASLPGPSALTNGTGIFQVTFKTAGSQTVTASDPAKGLTSGNSSSISVSPAAADHFTVIVPSTATTGLPVTIAVNALDAFGNVATSYSGTVHFASNDAQAVLPPNSPLANGLASFSVTLKSVGNQTTITATDTATASITGKSSAINIVSNAPTHLLVVTLGNATTRAPISVLVKALDGANNISVGYSGTVHFTSTDGKAILPADATLPNGIGNFSATLETAGNQTLTATDTAPTAITGTSSSISVMVAPALAIISGAPPKGTVGVDYGSTHTEYQKCVLSHIFGQHWVCHPCTPITVRCGTYPPCYSGTVCILATQVFTGFKFAATGGVPPYKWSASGLPPGLTVNPPNGEILGTPTTANPYNISVSVTDSGLPNAQFSANYTITIVLPPPPVVNTTPPPSPGVVNQPYSFTFAASGAQPFTWSESGPLPNGLAFSDTTGVLSGTPTIAGSFPIAVTAHDQYQQASAAQNFTITVSLHGFQAIGSMMAARELHSAVRLCTGKILVSGGQFNATNLLATAELFDPTTGIFTATGSMQISRSAHTSTSLGTANTSKALIAGGQTGSAGNATVTAELYEPTTGTFSTTGSMQTARYGQTATLLNNGKVLLAGGQGANGNPAALASAELYDVAAGTFSATGSMQTARSAHTATLLANGKVLVTGGSDANLKNLATAEVYDPSTGTFTAVAGMMTVTRSAHTSTLLNTGKVLVVGGVDDTGKARNTAELFDSVSGSFTATTNLVTAHASHTATLLPDGTVLLAGGVDATGAPIAAVELFDPNTGNFSSTGSLVTARKQHTATLLSNGKVLVTGGVDATGNVLASAELYQ